MNKLSGLKAVKESIAVSVVLGIAIGWGGAILAGGTHDFISKYHWDKKDVAATVNGKVIPKVAVMTGAAMEAQRSNADPDEIVDKLLQGMVDEQVLAEAAEKIPDIVESPDVIAGIDQQRRNSLAMAYAKYWSDKTKPSDKDINQEFEEFKNTLGKTEYEFRHIQFPVGKKADAEKVFEDLSSGKHTFESVAADANKNGANATNAFWRPEGVLSEPIKKGVAALNGSTGYFLTNPSDGSGIYVVNVISKRNIEVDMNKVKPTLVSNLRRKAVMEQLAALRKVSNIVIAGAENKSQENPKDTSTVK